MSEIRFDDVAALNAAASSEFGDYGDQLTVTQEMIREFADLTGDQQWIHVDVERAQRESPFGGPIAHGFLTLSLLPKIAVRPVELTGYASATNYGSDSLRFLAPVPAGSTVHARARLVEAVARPSGGTVVTTEHEVSVVGAPKPALLYSMIVLYRG
ncbi:MAG TPA: MaoC family dehydratase [Mycobacteriales bacterium]|nr:MaoC family dehydratase [Mycobacteriales bacterium]